MGQSFSLKNIFLTTMESKDEKKIEMDHSEDKETDDKMSLEPTTDWGDAEIELVAKDGKRFKLLKKYAVLSRLVKEAMTTDPDTSEMPLPSVSSHILARMVDYLNRCKGVKGEVIEKPLRSKNLAECIKRDDFKWFAAWIGELDAACRQDLYDFILAANYMDVDCALNSSCAQVAGLIKGEPLEKIKEILSKGATPKEESKSS